ncbi:MAG: amino acid permease, partial [Halothiobacillus sp.]|nr:amino acid permease [Halothiobacillus sp.]
VRIIVICGVVISLVAGLVPLGELAELVNIGTLAAFVLVSLGVIVLRMRQPDLPRPFKNPFGYTLPILGILSCGALMMFLPVLTWIRFLGWLAIGMVIYFAYSYRHSHLGAEPKA